MVIYKSQDLADDRVLVMDADSGKQWVLPAALWDEIAHLPVSEQETRIRQHLDASAAEWQRERGPESELGRNVEQGTPTADHGGSAPSTSEEAR